MLLQDAVAVYFLASDLTPKSRRWYTQKLNRFITWCQQHECSTHTPPQQVADLDTNHLREFIDHVRHTSSPGLNKPMGSQTLHGYARVIKAFLNWCVVEGLIAESVTRRYKMPKREQKVIQVFSDSDIRRLYEAAGQVDAVYPWFAERDKAILAVLLDTGIRANELCTLTLPNTHLTSEDAYLVVDGKGRKQREVGLGQRARFQLGYYIKHARPKSSSTHVFLTRALRPLQPEGLDRILYRLRDRAGIEGIRVSAHTFRHTYACRYIEEGGDVYKLSRVLGHTSVSVTEIYLRAFASRDARSGASVFDGVMQRKR